MSRSGSVIIKAVVEQEIRFDSEFYFDQYLRKLDYYEEPYKVVSKTFREGRLFVVIRKRYGEYPFLGDVDPYTISEESIKMRDESRGVVRNDDGSLSIVDMEKYWNWQNNASKKSRY